MPEWAELQRKTRQRGLLITSYQKKKTLIGLQLLQLRQSVSLDTWRARIPATQAAVPTACSTLTGAELPQAKKVLASMHMGLLQ